MMPRTEGGDLDNDLQDYHDLVIATKAAEDYLIRQRIQLLLKEKLILEKCAAYSGKYPCQCGPPRNSSPSPTPHISQSSQSDYCNWKFPPFWTDEVATVICDQDYSVKYLLPDAFPSPDASTSSLAL